jgi:PAS domain S-box-containing protein
MTRRLTQIAFRTSAAYLAVSAAWILLSDSVVERMTSDPHLLRVLQTYKGLVFVGTTTVLLYLYVRRQMGSWDAEVAARQRAEAASRESDRRLRTLFESSPDGLALVGPGGHVVEVNGTGTRLLACVPGGQLPDGVPPEGRSALSSVVAAAQKGQHGRLELQLPPSGGRESILRIELQALPLPHSDGLALVVLRDVTEARRTAEALREGEARLRQIIDLVPVAIFAKDAEGRFLLANATMARRYGKAPSELVGTTQREQTAVPDEAERFLAIDREVITSGQPIFIPAQRFTDRKGVVRTVQTTKIPYAIPGTGGTGVLGCSVDITDLFAAEQRVWELNRDLEKRIRERTAELEAANRELEAFSYSVSHDLRAPLRAIDGFSLAVLEDHGATLPPEGRRHLGIVREGAQRMGALIDDLLAFSRLNRVPLVRRPVAMRSLVDKAVAELAPARAGRNVEFTVHDLPDADGDPALLLQVWVNLISNAQKYSRLRDPARIGIGSDPGPEGAVYWIRDNGAGFDMRYASKLFGVFQRLHRSEDYEGTGVGLAIVQRIVHRHGGRISAESSVDHGAVFRFSLGKSTPS